MGDWVVRVVVTVVVDFVVVCVVVGKGFAVVVVVGVLVVLVVLVAIVDGRDGVVDDVFVVVGDSVMTLVTVFVDVVGCGTVGVGVGLVVFNVVVVAMFVTSEFGFGCWNLVDIALLVVVVGYRGGSLPVNGAIFSLNIKKDIDKS